jgi:hypothetical protein
MKIPPKSWAHRTLRGNPNYHHCSDEAEFCREYAAWAKEDLVGVYVASSEDPELAIVITNTGLYRRVGGEIHCLEFQKIRELRAPTKESGEGLIEVTDVDGNTISLVVPGRHGQHRDVYEFVRFLDRVIDGS